MAGIRRLAALITTLLLVTAGCGGTDATTSTAPASTTMAGSSTTSAVTTSTAPATGPLDPLDGRLVEDPLYGSGYHELATDESGQFAYSVDPILGEAPDANLLGLGALPEVETTGIGEDILAVVAFVQNATAEAEPAPAGLVLYGQGPEGWGVVVAITDPAILGFLETTTDYQAWKPHDGTFYARTTVKTLDWDGTAAHFVADVHVLDYPANAAESFYEVECTVNGALACTLLSDDGVLRPGDEGEAVEELQLALIEIGYLSGEADGKYGPATESAVRSLQRDFRLTRDGKVGPNTHDVINDILAGEIVLASKNGIGSVDIDTNANPARDAIIALLGSPDSETGWVNGPCGPSFEWNVLSWGGFSVYLTERDGPRLFDGWRVQDLATVPNFIYFAGGIAQNWRWSNFDAMGADYDPFYQFWYHTDLGYGIGTFATSQGDPPDPNAVIEEFGTGSGNVLYDC